MLDLKEAQQGVYAPWNGWWISLAIGHFACIRLLNVKICFLWCSCLHLGNEKQFMTDMDCLGKHLQAKIQNRLWDLPKLSFLEFLLTFFRLMLCVHVRLSFCSDMMHICIFARSISYLQSAMEGWHYTKGPEWCHCFYLHLWSTWHKMTHFLHFA